MFEPCETAANVATAANELTPAAEAVRRFAALATDAEPLVRLTDAINRCCAARGDDERNRLTLHAECQALPGVDQTDLAEHFEEEAARWEAATSGKNLGSSQPIAGRGRSDRELESVNGLRNW